MIENHYLLLLSLSLLLIDVAIVSEIPSWIAIGLISYVAVDVIDLSWEYRYRFISPFLWRSCFLLSHMAAFGRKKLSIVLSRQSSLSPAMMALLANQLKLLKLTVKILRALTAKFLALNMMAILKRVRPIKSLHKTQIF